MSAKVLVVDDAGFMRAALKDILTRAGFDVVGEAKTGEEALAQFKVLKPELITMDIVMPGMNGIETTRKIIALDPAARVLMCSAMGQQALVIEAIQAGARDFVIKPFHGDRVVEACRRVLGA